MSQAAVGLTHEMCELKKRYFIRYIHKAPVRVFKLSKRRQKLRLRRAMVTIKFALAQEKQETREMLAIYRRYTQGAVSKEELKVANQQFVDILKGVGLGVFAVLPFAPITIPLVVKLANIVGVDILPSSFSIKAEDKKEREPGV